MAQGKDDLRARLQQAALELYREHGYDRTTTAEIAARAGVTERTFFRHFPDKREILFDEDPDLRPALTRSVAEAPVSLTPLEVVLQAFALLEPMLEHNRPFAEPRMMVIAATPALQERAAAKTASLTAHVSGALQRRGAEPKLATLAARVGMAVFSHALNSWRDDPSISLAIHLKHTVQALQALLAL